MSSINKAIIIGNLGRDPEFRTTQNGDAVANLSIATAEAWKDKATGERKERTEWHRVVLWGQLAEIANKYLAKGSKVYVEGQIQTRKWQDKDGQDRYSTEIVLRGFDSKLVMLDGKRDGEPEGKPAANRTQQHTRGPSRNKEAAADMYDDDIPF